MCVYVMWTWDQTVRTFHLFLSGQEKVVTFGLLILINQSEYYRAGYSKLEIMQCHFLDRLAWLSLGFCRAHTCSQVVWLCASKESTAVISTDFKAEFSILEILLLGRLRTSWNSGCDIFCHMGREQQSLILNVKEAVRSEIPDTPILLHDK